MNTNRNKNFKDLFLLIAVVLAVIPTYACAAQISEPNPNEKIIQKDAAPKKISSGCQSAAEDIAQIQPTEWKGSKLHKAVKELDAKTVEVLLRKGSDVNAKDNYGDTPLTSIVTPKIEEPSLLPPGVEPNAQTRENNRRRQSNQELSQLKILKLLLENKADANQKNSAGKTPLMITASFGYKSSHAVKILSQLIQHKTDINSQDEHGNTALMEAVGNNRYEIVKFLLSHNADPKLESCNGATALSIAEQNNRSEIISLLKQPQ